MNNNCYAGRGVLNVADLRMFINMSAEQLHLIRQLCSQRSIDCCFNKVLVLLYVFQNSCIYLLQVELMFFCVFFFVDIRINLSAFTFDVDRARGVCHVMYFQLTYTQSQDLLFMISVRFQFLHFDPLFCRKTVIFFQAG